MAGGKPVLLVAVRAGADGLQTALLLPESNALISGYAPQDTSVATTVRCTSVRPGF